MRKIIIPCLMLGAGLALGAALDRQWLRSRRAPAGLGASRSDAIRSSSAPYISVKPSVARSGKSHRPVPARIITDFTEATSALQEAQTIKNRLQQYERLKTLAGEIDPSLYPRLKEMADRITDPAGKDAFASELVSCWARLDGTKAAEYLQALPSSALRTGLLTALAETWLDENQSSAMDWILTHAPPSDREALYEILMRHLGKSDPAKGFNVLNSLPKGSQRYNLLQTLFSVWSDADPAAAAQKLLELKPWELNACLESVLPKWMELDPQKAMAWVNSLPQKFNRSTALAILSISTADHDPLLAVGLAQKSLNGSNQQRAIGEIVRKWATADLSSARAWVDSLPPGRNKLNALDSLIGEWSRRDPEAAMAFVKNLPSGQSQANLINQVANNVANQDPKAAVEWLKVVGGERALRNGLGNVIARWADSDPASAANYLISLPAGSNLRSDALSVLVGAWSSHDVPGTVNFIKSLPSQEQTASASSLVETLSRTDPKAAAAYAAEFKIGSAAFGPIAREWSMVDLDGAVNWAKSLSDPKFRDPALENLGSQWVENDPKGVAEYIKTAEPSPSRLSLLQSLASDWAQNDLRTALAWAGALQNDEDRNQANASIASSWAQVSPADAAKFTASLLPGEAQNDAAGEVVRRWSVSDPASAATWAVNFPAGETRDEAFQVIASAWADQDSKGAAEWINSLPASSSREAALVAMAEAMSGNNPQTGLQWAAKISDQEKRADSTKNILRGWMQYDPLHAGEQVRSSSLSDSDKKEILDTKPSKGDGGHRIYSGGAHVY